MISKREKCENHIEEIHRQHFLIPDNIIPDSIIEEAGNTPISKRTLDLKDIGRKTYITTICCICRRKFHQRMRWKRKFYYKTCCTPCSKFLKSLHGVHGNYIRHHKLTLTFEKYCQLRSENKLIRKKPKPKPEKKRKIIECWWCFEETTRTKFCCDKCIYLYRTNTIPDDDSIYKEVYDYLENIPRDIEIPYPREIKLIFPNTSYIRINMAKLIWKNTSKNVKRTRY